MKSEWLNKIEKLIESVSDSNRDNQRRGRSRFLSRSRSQSQNHSYGDDGVYNIGDLELIQDVVNNHTHGNNRETQWPIVKCGK